MAITDAGSVEMGVSNSAIHTEDLAVQNKVASPSGMAASRSLYGSFARIRPDFRGLVR
jgi:hypothetical protein